MKKFTKLMLAVLMVLYLNTAMSANALEITAILAPAQGTQIVIGQSTQFQLELTNNHTITFTTQDTGLIVLGFFNGSTITNLQAIGGYIPQSDLLPGGKTTITFNLTFNGLQPGTYAPAFGFIWRKNPNPTSATFQYRSYQFVNSSGLAERFSRLNDMYYSLGNLYLNIENRGNQQVGVTLINLNGQLVKYESFRLSGQGIFSKTLNVADLPQGIYIVSLNIDGNITTKKIMIN